MSQYATWPPTAISGIVPVANGGTGASTAAGARANLGAFATSGGTFTGAVTRCVVTLTDAPTITVDASLGNHFRVTLGGNRTMANPTNPTDGQMCSWEFIQDATGSRTITLDSQYSFGTDIIGVTLSTAPNKRDFMGAIYNANTTKWYVIAYVKGY